MLGNEKLLFDELYEKTKDCGRVQFVELLMTKERENQELKSQLKGTTHCFDEEEHEKLKKQLEKLKEKKQEWINLLAMFKNQQKEFIEYLESEIDRLEKTEFYIDSIQKAAIETHKHNLSKYKEIIGGKE